MSSVLRKLCLLDDRCRSDCTALRYRDDFVSPVRPAQPFAAIFAKQSLTLLRLMLRLVLASRSAMACCASGPGSV